MGPQLLQDRLCVECVHCNEQSRTVPCEHCNYPDPKGTPAQREEISRLKRVAQGIVTNIGRGMRLRIPHDPTERIMVVKGYRQVELAEFEVTREEAAFTLATRGLKRVPDKSGTEIVKAEHPKTRQLVNVSARFVGADELGYDVDKADWYCLVS